MTISGEQSFYFSTTRKITAAFGKIFSDIRIKRRDPDDSVRKTIRVPLSYGSREPWVSALRERNRESDARVHMIVPRMSYEMVDISPNPSRQIANTGTHIWQHFDDMGVRNYFRQFHPVPVDYSFNLGILTNKIDDGLQIIEQIIPHFRQSYNVTIEEIPQLNFTRDVPIIYNSMDFQDEYEGSPEELRRIITWNMSFTAQGYLYPPIQDAEIIRKVIATIYNDEEFENEESIITAEVDPIDADEDDDWNAKVTIEHPED